MQETLHAWIRPDIHSMSVTDGCAGHHQYKVLQLQDTVHVLECSWTCLMSSRCTEVLTLGPASAG